MLYVHMDLYSALGRFNNQNIEEKTITLGPFTKIRRGYQGEMFGVSPEEKEIPIFEATVGHGGYCETCAYDYPDFSYTERIDKTYKSWEVKDFTIDENPSD